MIPLPTADLPWYVVHTRPQQEMLAASVLQTNLPLRTYVPEVLQSRHGQRRLAPLFPGYIFVQPNAMGLPVTAINRSPGVLHVVTFDALPQSVTCAVVAALRATVERVNAGGGLSQHSFQPGDTVRVRSGPMAGLEGSFVGPLTPAARVQVLLDFLGGRRPLSIAPAELEVVAHQKLQARCSRGTGRPIPGAQRTKLHP